MKATTALLTVSCLLGAFGCGGSAEPPDSGLRPTSQEDATGASATVRPDENQFVENVEEMLRGHVSGLQVLDHPECGLTIRIRGVTDSINPGAATCDREPLLIIDDKPVPPGTLIRALRGLAPSQIDRIRVLKDVSSTSVYGTRGANGVILVTTKRG
jgi:TonB-dependent SusC/RagA subfamily outer membrane receptor